MTPPFYPLVIIALVSIIIVLAVFIRTQLRLNDEIIKHLGELQKFVLKQLPGNIEK